MQPAALYIHVPFCARRCFYCDFAVEARRDPPVAEWIEAIGREAELQAVASAWQGPVVLDSLYVGGGTPSLLGPGALSSLKGRLAAIYQLAEGAEWTSEANPESFTSDLARDWVRAGVNRLSLGAQTFSKDALRWMGRLHGPEGIGQAVQTARSAGFGNLSIDLIFGLPSHLDRDWRRDLDACLALDPEHVSLYGLTAEAGAPLGRWFREGRVAMIDEERYAEEYLLAHELLCAEGYEHYEVSNFARPGCTSRHNGAYWTGEPYAALGPGAHAFAPPRRTWNVRSWEQYANLVRRNQLPLEGEELLTEADRDLEAIWLGLRTYDGVEIGSLGPKQRRIVDLWTARDLASVADGRVRLTVDGWLVLDALAVELGSETAPRAPAERIDVPEGLVQISKQPIAFNADDGGRTP